MLFPSLKEVGRLSEMYSVIPVFWEIPAEHWSPLQIYAALSRSSVHAFLLEGISTPAGFCRWSYIGCDPQLLVRAKNGRTEVSAFGSTYEAADTEQLVQEILNGRRSPVFLDCPEFTGGFAGFCLADEATSCTFGLYDEIIAYDHLKSTAVIILNLHTGTEITAQYQAAEIRAAQLAAEIEGFRLSPQFRDDAPPIRVKEGGVENAPDSFELYRRIRSHFPSPHLCFCKEDDERLAASCALAKQGERRADAIAGYRGYNGSDLRLFTEQAVHYADVTTAFASIRCERQEDVQHILELMRSAKFENTAI
ncbi:MAG: hypothetical protein IKK51_10090 [Oscillospiraceae bacterium]|nr:hypothetical protein [Oscillospiraceae bacterium]